VDPAAAAQGYHQQLAFSKAASSATPLRMIYTEGRRNSRHDSRSAALHDPPDLFVAEVDPARSLHVRRAISAQDGTDILSHNPTPSGLQAFTPAR
jgi:hypothetical protein